MRTLVDIPEQDLRLLTTISKTEKVSRAELIRRAVTAYLAPRRQKWSGLDAAFGMWADMQEDGGLIRSASARSGIGMRTIFDTNILIDLLKGLEIARTELKRYSSVAI